MSPDLAVGTRHPGSVSVENRSAELPLVDRFGRIHRSLRISVTDACNIRCRYCMPEENVRFLAANRLLSFEHIVAFVRAVVPLGITRLRLTGGEPLLRPRLGDLVAQLNRIDGVVDLALTTNGMLLEERIEELVKAGLRRVNVSLDTLDEQVFQTMSRRKGLERVLRGIDAALAQPNIEVKLNTLVLRNVNYDGVLQLVDFALHRGLPLRFIEFMPLDADGRWSRDQVVSGSELREQIEQVYGRLQPVVPEDPSRPAKEYRVEGFSTTLGFIDTVSAPFCGTCDRIRITADGKLRNCLFGKQEWDVSQLLRENASPERVQQLVRECVGAKRQAHGIDQPDFLPPERAMYQIGG